MLGQTEEIWLCVGGSSSAASSSSDTITAAVAPFALSQHLLSLVQNPACPFLPDQANPAAAGPPQLLPESSEKPESKGKEEQVDKSL